MKRWIFRIIFVVDIVIMFVFVYLVEFNTKVDITTGIRYDGFGRTIVSAPLIMRYIAVHEWSGLTWWIIDWLLGFAMLAIAYFSYDKMRKK